MRGHVHFQRETAGPQEVAQGEEEHVKRLRMGEGQGRHLQELRAVELA